MSTSPKIHLLPEHIIDQIKAGEVIERPSTLVKEILENSLDAGATQIDIHIINNGLDLISLTDNGIGIESEELPLAFCRHATSKIKRFEDIYHLSSYGFRGEALASIASISKITCETQTSKSYGLIKIEGGETITHQQESKSSSETGTKLFIKDLFYNTPVRMKFIQSKTSEKNQLKKVINSFLLLNPQIAFSLKWDEEEKVFYEAYSSEEQTKRISDVFGSKHQLSFHHQQTSYDGVHFEVFLSKESNRGNAHKNHYLFINERPIQDIQMHKIILNSAAHLWPEGETGHYLAFIKVPADEIDVNIHPNKTVIKLFRAPKVYSVISSTIKHIQYPQQTTSQSDSNQTVQSFQFSESQPNTEINYRSHNFKSDNQFENYFVNIHNNQSSDAGVDHMNQSFRILKRFEQLDLITFNHQLLIVSGENLARFHIRNLIEQQENELEVVPLMVSRPIHVNKKLSAENKQFFEKLGFELDEIASGAILLRSFPKDFQHFPYLSILEENFTSNKKILSYQDLSLNSLKDYKMSTDFMLQLFDRYNLVTLLENKVIKTLEESDIKDIYEKK